MRRLIAAITAVLFWASMSPAQYIATTYNKGGGGGGGVAFVNSNAVQCHGTNITTCALTLGFTPTAGHLVRVDIYTEGSGTSINLTTDNSGTTYSNSIASFNAGGPYFIREDYTCNILSSVSTITANFAANTVAVIFAAEYSGNPTSGCLDTTAAKNTATSTTASTASMTPVASQNEVVGGFCFQTTNNTTPFTNSGAYTVRTSIPDNTQGNYLGIMDQIVASTTGSYTPQAAISTSVTWLCWGSTFK